MRFVSHLDMNRFMTRVIRKTNIPVWYTQGFNSRLYIAFALPLSLGFESDYEAMDLKITDDGYSPDDVVKELKNVVPDSIVIVSAAEPIKKVSDIAFADFEILFDGGDGYAEDISRFLQREHIITQKKNKKGEMKQIDLADSIIKKNVTVVDGNVQLCLTLPAGNNGNVNPQLILSAFESDTGIKLPFCSVTRTAIYDGNFELFV